jgi:hypothetical protein
MRFDPDKPKTLEEIGDKLGMGKYGISIILNNFLRLVKNKMVSSSVDNLDLI